METQELKKFYRLTAEHFNMEVCNIFSGVLLNPSKKIPYASCENHGSFIAEKKHFDWAVDSFKEIAEVIGELGMKLAFETHPGYLHDTLESTLKLIDI